MPEIEAESGATAPFEPGSYPSCPSAPPADLISPGSLPTRGLPLRLPDSSPSLTGRSRRRGSESKAGQAQKALLARVDAALKANPAPRSRFCRDVARCLLSMRQWRNYHGYLTDPQVRALESWSTALERPRP